MSPLTYAEELSWTMRCQKTGRKRRQSVLQQKQRLDLFLIKTVDHLLEIVWPRVLVDLCMHLNCVCFVS